MPREKPILMSTPMVQAILEGRKTMTRRVVRPQPPQREDHTEVLYKYGDGWRYTDCDYKDDVVEKCPYGAPGDRLWVRETFFNSRGDDSMPTYYRADQDSLLPADHNYHAGPWKPSIFMPRWASRITLEITGIRVERLQNISEEDAKDEGVVPSIVGYDYDNLKYRAGFQTIWASINGKKHPWTSNPWVWVISFKVVK